MRGRGDHREQRPRLTRCPRGRCSCRVLLSKRSTCTRVDTRSPACQPPGERDPPGMEAQEVRRRRQFSHRRDVYMMRRRRRRGRRRLKEWGFSPCGRSGCSKLQDMQLHVQAGGQKVPRDGWICHERGLVR